MTIAVRESGGARVVDLAGDVDLGSSPELRSALADLLRQSQKLALNMQALRYIDSSGIATLIEIFKDAQSLQKQFVLFGLSAAVQEVFRLTHVNRIFEVYPTEKEAVASA